MDPFVHEWLNLLVRWLHITVGIAWIGTSFYFNWLEGRLDRRAPKGGVAGELWSVHGGGFYHLQKYEVAPQKLPEILHWFKWEAYTTWLSGFLLLGVVFYLRPDALLGANPLELSAGAAIGLSLTSLFGVWAVYQGLTRMLLPRSPRIFLLIALALMVALSFALLEIYAPRAAFLHFGAILGTIMAANVFVVIIPAQRRMVQAMMAGETPDPAAGKRALNHSLHNNYLTLPVLFTMVSAHFPSTYGSANNVWIILALAFGSALIRHFFNVRNRGNRQPGWIFAGLATIALSIWLSRPADVDGSGAAVAPPLWQVLKIVDERCAACHSASPSQPGFAIAPAGLMFDDLRQIQAAADVIYQQAVATEVMPPGNLTAMTEDERTVLRRWVESGAGTANR